MVWMPVMGVAAGVITTVAGLGGGVLLVLALSLIMPASAALAATTPALLLGNAHRAHLYRADVDRRLAWLFSAGALPGALVGGLLLGALPESVARFTMLGLMSLALYRAVGKPRWTPPPQWVLPAGAVVGLLTASGGGAGILAAPVLMGAGLKGNRYLATAATVSVVMHGARMLAYGAVGLWTPDTVMMALLLAAGVLLGNALGRGLRQRMDDAALERMELGAMVVGVGLAVAGVA